MLRSILRASVVAGIVFGTADAFAFSTGPPLSRTGAPAIGGKPAEGLCTLCHNLNPANMPNGKVEILDLRLRGPFFHHDYHGVTVLQ